MHDEQMHDEQRTLETALSLHTKGDISGAAELYRRIIDANPNNLRALHFLGAAEIAAGNIDAAKSLMARSLQASQLNLEFVENYATDLYRAGEHDAVIEACQQARRSGLDSATLWHVSVSALIARNRYPEALEQLDQFLASHPNHFIAHFLRGSALAKTKQYDAALASYERAVAINPLIAEAHLDTGTIHAVHQRHQEALAAYDRAVAARPVFAEAWLARGHALLQLGRHQEALAAADKALELRSDYADAWVGRGNALLELDRYQDAAAAYDRALALRPALAAAWCGHGTVFLRTGRHRDAGVAFDRALEADSNLADAWLGRALMLVSLGRHDEAIAALDRALALNPTLPTAWIARGQVLYFKKRYDEALADWNKALSLRPDLPDVQAACLRVRMHHCDWIGFDAACALLRSAVDTGKPVPPFMLVAIPSTASEQLRCARRWVASTFRTAHEPAWRGERYDHDRIHVAYLSADFHQHATSYLMAGLFEHHDRSRFQLSGISVGPNDGSEMRRRIEAAFERFVDASSLADDQIADMVRSLEVDILVDLKGFTQDARPLVFARRPAPIQVSYLGFPGTTGAGFIDYIVADRILIPEDQHGCYAEKVVSLPDSYQANDDRRPVAAGAPAREAFGLPSDGFVFCCFNDNYKITPGVFSVWMRILDAVEGSVLWLFEENPTAADNLRREAAARRIAPERLVFARRLANAEHLARHRCADLFLDTLPYNAHTTASDALWAGLPVLTCIGNTFAGRVAASLLNAIGLPELVTPTLEAYEQSAVTLARDPARLAALKATLVERRSTAPLFDTARFTRNIEAAYVAMVERHRDGLAPDHIQVIGAVDRR